MDTPISPMIKVEESESLVSPINSSDKSPLPPVPVSPINIPDGGTQAWLCVLGGFCIAFSTFGYCNAFGVYQDYYVLQGASTSSNISWIGSLQLFFMFSMGLPAGKLFDQGYFRHVIGFGSLLYIFSMFMLSLADPTRYYQLILSQGIGMGIGSGFMLVPAMSVQAHHWRKRRSLAMGIVMSGTGVGGIVYPIMLNRLIHGSVGFHWGVRATAFLTLGLLVIANLTMSTRLPPSTDRNTISRIKVIVTELRFLLLLSGLFLVLLGLFFTYFYLQLWVNLHGLSETLGFYTIAILNAASLPGRTIPNMLSDRYGMFNVFVPVSFITGALAFVMFGVTSTAAVIIYSIFYGFFSGAYIALLVPTVVSVANSVQEVGLRLGCGYFITSFAMLFGTPITGALYGIDGQWFRPIVFSGVVMIAGSIVTLAARQSYSKKKSTQRL